MKSLFTILFLCTFCSAYAQNHCLHFDGEDDFVFFPNTNLQGDATISFYFKPGATSNGNNDDRIFAVGPGPRLEIGVADSDCFDGYIWVYDEPSSNQICFEANLRDGEWHQIVTVLNGDQRLLYLDGILMGEWMTFGDPIYVDNIRFGKWTGGGNSTNYGGMLDEMRIWNYARTLEEIEANRFCELEGTEAGLVDYYNFNQGIAGGDNGNLEDLWDVTTPPNHGELRNLSLSGNTSNFVLSEAPLDCDPNSVSTIEDFEVAVAPNPTNGICTLTTDFQGASLVNIYSIHGKLISSKTFTFYIELDFSDFVTGVYTLEVVNDGDRVVEKLMRL